MDVNGFIEGIGRQRVIELTGLTKGRISQWVSENKMPRPWVKFFAQRFPAKAREHGLEPEKDRAA